jgi:hypothetical protein
MLIAEEMFLLLTEDNGTTDRASRHRRFALAAAALADLAEAGVVAVAEGEDPKVTVVRAGTTGQAALDTLLPVLDAVSGRRIGALVGNAALNPETAIGRSLARQGIVAEERRLLGRPRFLTLNPAPEIALRERLGQVLSGRREAGRADATELGILHALNIASGLLGPARGGLDRRGLARRIESIARDDPFAEAVKNRMGTLTAATMAGTGPGATATA